MPAGGRSEHESKYNHGRPRSVIAVRRRRRMKPKVGSGVVNGIKNPGALKAPGRMTNETPPKLVVEPGGAV